MHPANNLRNLKNRVYRARDFPNNTCAASRHLHLIAKALACGKKYAQIDEDPKYVAESMLAVLEALFKARTELRRQKTTG